MPPAQNQPRLPSQREWFATTHWSVVLNAADSVSPHAGNALEDLCRSYWYPLYAYVRRRGYDSETAKDLTQDFFAQLLSKRLLHAVDPTKGRFRSWLLAVMKHFLAHEWTKGQALKRGGGQPVFSLDELEAENRYRFEPPEENDSEKIFDRRWALTVMDRAAARLREEYAIEGKAELYRTLKGFVSSDGAPLNYEQAANASGLSIGAVKSAIRRLRLRYQELIRNEIAQTVATSSEVDEEIRYLLKIVRG